MYKDNNNKAKHGESFIYQKLIDKGFKVKWVALANRKSKADFILQNGKTIDVKYATPSRSTYQCISKKEPNKEWSFNFHHHGQKQSDIDFFICVLQDIGDPLIFIFPSELVESYDMSISSRKLERGTYDYFKDNWDLLRQK